MLTLLLLAGPNGAGKTTFIDRVLKRRAQSFVFVNPDEVARDLPFLSSSSGERSETGGPSGAGGDLFRQAVVNSGASDRFALSRAAGSPGLRGCAARRRMTKERGDHAPPRPD